MSVVPSMPPPSMASPLSEPSSPALSRTSSPTRGGNTQLQHHSQPPLHHPQHQQSNRNNPHNHRSSPNVVVAGGGGPPRRPSDDRTPPPQQQLIVNSNDVTLPTSSKIYDEVSKYNIKRNISIAALWFCSVGVFFLFSLKANNFPSKLHILKYSVIE